MTSVVCWKWKPEPGAKHEAKRNGFSAGHVNRLRAMVERNTTVRHEFICVTDDWKGLHSSVKVVNVDRHFGEFKELGGCFRRLRAFDQATGLALFGERFVSMDLDAVIVGNIDNVLKISEDFKIWFDKNRRRTPYCGSLWGMRSGARQEVWDSFQSGPYSSIEVCERLKYTGTDQAHISVQLYNRESVWTKDDGILNFNTAVRKQVRNVYRANSDEVVVKRIGGDLPAGARIVFFNGKFDPSQRVLQVEYPWIGDHWNVAP
jgi:hypothetical protein